VLDLLREVGRLRLAEARQRDVVTYQRAELEVRIGEEGFGFVVVADARTDVELYNEQISLLCNVEGARLIAERGVRAAYRVHPSPPDGRLLELERLIANIVAAHKLDPALWRWRRRRTPTDPLGEPLSDYLLRIRDLAGHERVRLAIERLAMVSNVRSEFAAEPGPHYGIGAPMYARLTAPMREMVGVHTHAVALSAIGAGGWGEDDPELLERIIDTANRARAVQRELTKAANMVVIDSVLRADEALPEAERPWRRGTIVELRSTRAYVQLDDPPIELKLYDDDLGASRELLRGGAVLRIGARRLLRVGAPVDLRVVGHDPRRDRWRFTVLPVRDGEPRRRAAHSAGRIPTE
jgi:ribonuclease R